MKSLCLIPTYTFLQHISVFLRCCKEEEKGKVKDNERDIEMEMPFIHTQKHFLELLLHCHIIASPSLEGLMRESKANSDTGELQKVYSCILAAIMIFKLYC